MRCASPPDRVVGEYDAERLVADEHFAAENGIAQPEHFDLAGVREGGIVNDVTNLRQHGFLGAAPDLVFQFVAEIKVILNGPFAAPGDDHDVIHAGVHGFFHAVLNQRLGKHRQHFLRYRLGGRQKAGAVAGGGE